MSKKYKVDDTKDREEVGEFEGLCPYCKESSFLEYEGPDIQDGQIFYDIHCANCDNDFQEWYDVEFAGQWGYPLKNRKKSKKEIVYTDCCDKCNDLMTEKKYKKNKGLCDNCIDEIN